MRTMRTMHGCEKMATIECTFTHAKETKGTHQYREDGDVTKIGTIYLKKHILTDGVPDKISVKVEW